MNIKFLILIFAFAASLSASGEITLSPAPLEQWIGTCERDLERRGNVVFEGHTECTMYLLGVFAGAGHTGTCGYDSIPSLLRSYIAFARESDQSRSFPQVTLDFVTSSCASAD
jgi:hypothetical protein